MTPDDEQAASAYHPPDDWPPAGTQVSDEDLAVRALAWIRANARYLIVLARAQMSPLERSRSLWEPADVVARLADRAARGKGLTGSLRKHVDGVQEPIADPQRLMCAHLQWIIGEYRKEAAARARHEHLGDLDADAPLRVDLDGDTEVDSYYTALIQSLTVELGREAARLDLDSRGSAAYLQDREKALWKILCRYAPSSVTAELSRWHRDDQVCALLGLFPLQLGSQLIANYRTLIAQDPTCAITEEATRKKISRLRQRIMRVWPPDQVPAQLMAPADAGPQARRRP